LEMAGGGSHQLFYWTGLKPWSSRSQPPKWLELQAWATSSKYILGLSSQEQKTWLNCSFNGRDGFFFTLWGVCVCLRNTIEMTTQKSKTPNEDSGPSSMQWAYISVKGFAVGSLTGTFAAWPPCGIQEQIGRTVFCVDGTSGTCAMPHIHVTLTSLPTGRQAANRDLFPSFLHPKVEPGSQQLTGTLCRRESEWMNEWVN
jgi:hypothetical protein